ncbi:MAG: transglycosylase SLT domain-containing protein [Candidatus Gottesmanbacteria bacterium]
MRIFLVFFILGFLIGFIIFRLFNGQIKLVSSNLKVKGAMVSPLSQEATITPTSAPVAKPSPIIKPVVTPEPTLIPEVTPTPEPSPSITPTPTPVPIIVSSDLEELFRKYGQAYNIDEEQLKRIAKCESSLNPNAQTKDYAGLFQFSQSLWKQTRTLMGENQDQNLRLDPEEAIKTAAFMVSQNQLGIWPNCS